METVAAGPGPTVGHRRRRARTSPVDGPLDSRADERPVRQRVPWHHGGPGRQVTSGHRRHGAGHSRLRQRGVPAVPTPEPALLHGHRLPGLPARRHPRPHRGPGRWESTTFVLRQLAADGSEQGLVNGKWATVTSTTLAPGEHQMPMHAAPVAAFATPGTTSSTFGMSVSGRRTVYYGYIPVGMRDMPSPHPGPGGATRTGELGRTVSGAARAPPARCPVGPRWSCPGPWSHRRRKQDFRPRPTSRR